jgi:signal peptidase I
VRRRWGIPLLLLAGGALAVALVALHDTVRFYRVTSGSMQPALAIGARVGAEPGVPLRIGEIVVFDAPRGALPDTPVCGAAGEGSDFPTPCGLATPGTSNTVLVKRIVAGPGDLVALRAGRAIVNGVPSREPFAAACTEDPVCTFPRAVRVPAGEYFLLGDNRAASDDSRFWGPVPAGAILGVAVRCHLLQTACTPVS